jgi:serine/threonine protein kinase
VVLRGIDPNLKRPVALKVLRGAAAERDAERLASEARIVSKLKHPNVVTLYDFGLIGAKPYLVFELLEGTTLRDRLKENGAMDLRTAVVLMSQLLGGMAAAHERDIVHCDLSPNNIIITTENFPKVMDFGLSVLAQGIAKGTGEVMGTPRYMYPEPFHQKPVGPHSDVFALGAIFYEMLTGEPQFNANNRLQLVEDILTAVPRLPSAKVDHIPSIVDEVIAKALARNVDDRLPNAGAMKQLLDEYRIPREEGNSPKHSTVAFLLRRLKHVRGFSALSDRMDEVWKLTSNDGSGNARSLANTLAKDPMLMQRVLSTANSAMYGAGKITTLSRAIVTLGQRQTRLCVMNTLLESQFTSGSPALKSAMVASFFNADLCKTLAPAAKLLRREDAFIAGMFHSLGQMLAIHYFPEEYEAIQARSQDWNSELTASREVLGLPYHQLGIEVGREWKLPDYILGAMRPLPRGELSPPESEDERLGYLAGFANSVTHSISRFDPWKLSPLEARLAPLVAKIQTCLPIESSAVATALVTSAEVAEKYAIVIGVDPQACDFIQRLRNYLSPPELLAPEDDQPANNRPVGEDTVVLQSNHSRVA